MEQDIDRSIYIYVCVYVYVYMCWCYTIETALFSIINISL